MGMVNVSIIGMGRLGGALALALSEKGYAIDYLIHRGDGIARRVSEKLGATLKLATLENEPEINSEVVFITTGDPEILSTADALAPLLRGPAIIFQTSGSLSSEILSHLRITGAKIGSLHPLVSVSDPFTGAERLAGTYFCLEGDPEAVEAGRSIVRALGGTPFTIEPQYKSLYHASAVTSSGHLVALFDVAMEMLSNCGLDPARAKEILFPLLKSTIENLSGQSIADALTGSFARGDYEGVQRHLAAMRSAVSDNAKQVYFDLGMRSVDIAERRGIDREALAEIRSRISIAKTNLEC